MLAPIYRRGGREWGFAQSGFDVFDFSRIRFVGPLGSSGEAEDGLIQPSGHDYDGEHSPRSPRLNSAVHLTM